MSEQRKWRVSRRGFLIGLGATGAALIIGVRLGTPFARLKIAELVDGASGPGGNVSSASPDAWFEITPDNRFIFFAPKSEMGQGIHTALAQIAAEELEIDWDKLEVRHSPTDMELDAGITSASNSVSTLFGPLREIAATTREMLRQEAARQLGQTPETLVAEKGVFLVAGEADQAITYGEVVANAGDWDVPEEAPPLKPSGSFKVIGQSLSRVDLLAKVQGKAVYGYDSRLPNMLYGAVARPATIEGQLLAAEPGMAPERSGVVTVVTQKDFAGVVAESRAQAYGALSELDLEWDAGKRWQQEELVEMTTVGNGTGVVVQKEGDPKSNLNGVEPILGEYRTPFAAHAHLEPRAALADVREEGVTIWTSTQAPFTVRSQVADVLGRDEKEVAVIPTYLGGGLGNKATSEAALEAARLSAAAGRPVHVGWNRTEDLRYAAFRPMTHHILRATLDAGGQIRAMEHQQASGDVIFSTLPEIAAKIVGADFLAWRGATIRYGIPHRRTVAWRIRLPVRTAFWRGLGLFPNVFALESFMDELAHAAGTDPLDFRLRHLPEDELGQRMRRVLETVAERSGWGSKPPAGRARGLAICVDVNTVVAEVAEVSVEDNQIRVHQVTAAIDPGLIINPNGVIAQTQGAIIMGLSSTLHEEITIKDGAVDVSNFDNYPLLTNAEAPDITVVPISSGEEPYGVGEPPIGPIGAAVGNAIFALTNQRLRHLPFSL